MVSNMIENLAMIAAWLGEKDLACETACQGHSVSERRQLWRIKADAILGSSARRSVLRKNRRLPGA